MYPSKIELDKKWWHRLIKVVIWIFTISTALISVFCFVVGMQSGIETNYVLSLDPGYEAIKGEEVQLNEFQPWLEKYKIIQLFRNTEDPKVELDSNGKETKEYKKKRIKFLIEKGYIGTEDSSSDTEKVFNALISANKYFKIKKYSQYNSYFYWSFLFLIVGPISYFILNLIYYKIILYIAYGKNQKN